MTCRSPALLFGTISGRPLTPGANSSEAFSLVEIWLNERITHHDKWLQTMSGVNIDPKIGSRLSNHVVDIG